MRGGVDFGQMGSKSTLGRYLRTSCLSRSCRHRVFAINSRVNSRPSTSPRQRMSTSSGESNLSFFARNFLRWVTVARDDVRMNGFSKFVT